MPKTFLELLEGNEKFVHRMHEKDPHFFEELAKSQHPQFLWIGCADSRIPASEITDMKPGSIFVHRNIANLVIHSDMNMLSVVYYAVKVLQVKHIIVCGHYGCGGVNAAMSNKRYGFIDNWLRHIKDVAHKYRDRLEGISDETERGDRLTEFNVIEQVNNLAKVSFIQEEWENGRYPYIHGWVYQLDEGRIHALNCTINSSDHIAEEFIYELHK